MKKGQWTTNLKRAGFVGLLSLFGFVCVALSGPSNKELELKARAQRIFDYDNEFKNLLPSNKVRALSVALVFQNYEGAESILNYLESKIEL